MSWLCVPASWSYGTLCHGLWVPMSWPQGSPHRGLMGLQCPGLMDPCVMASQVLMSWPQGSLCHGPIDSCVMAIGLHVMAAQISLCYGHGSLRHGLVDPHVTALNAQRHTCTACSAPQLHATAIQQLGIGFSTWGCSPKTFGRALITTFLWSYGKKNQPNNLNLITSSSQTFSREFFYDEIGGKGQNVFCIEIVSTFPFCFPLKNMRRGEQTGR